MDQLHVAVSRSPSGEFGFRLLQFSVNDFHSLYYSAAEAQAYRELFAFAGKSGVPIRKVEKGSPAEEAGIEEWDVILSVNGSDASALGFAGVTKIVKLSDELDLVLTRGPCSASLAESLGLTPTVSDLYSTSVELVIEPCLGTTLGLSVADWNVTDLSGHLCTGIDVGKFKELLRFAPDGGVPVMTVTTGLPAAEAGLKRWDVLCQIDGEDVRRCTPATVRSKLDCRQRQTSLTVVVLRDLDLETRLSHLGITSVESKRRVEPRRLRLARRRAGGEYGFHSAPWTIRDLRRTLPTSELGAPLSALLDFSDCGVPVGSVVHGSVADYTWFKGSTTANVGQEAGLHVWDIIVAVDGTETRTLTIREFEQLVRAKDAMQLTVLRDSDIGDRALQCLPLSLRLAIAQAGGGGAGQGEGDTSVDMSLLADSEDGGDLGASRYLNDSEIDVSAAAGEDGDCQVVFEGEPGGDHDEHADTQTNKPSDKTQTPSILGGLKQRVAGAAAGVSVATMRSKVTGTVAALPAALPKKAQGVLEIGGVATTALSSRLQSLNPWGKGEAAKTDVGVSGPAPEEATEKPTSAFSIEDVDD